MAQTAYNDGLNLPYSLEAEQAVLGAILMDPESINQVADILRISRSYVSRIEKKALEELRAMMRKGASAGKG